MPKVTKKWTHWKEVTNGVFVRDGVVPAADLAVFPLLAAMEKDSGAPNSMNKYGKQLRSRLAQRIIADVVRVFVQPLVSAAYPKLRPLSLKPYAFTVEYDVKKQKRLAAHFDASDVTLNVCLSNTFKGGGLVMYDAAGRKPACTINQRLGRFIVHRGRHVHRAQSITYGRRTNLILWCKQVKRQSARPSAPR